VLLRALSVQATSEAARQVVLALLLAELIAAAGARQRPRRSHTPPRSAPRPARRHRPARDALSGRRPRG